MKVKIAIGCIVGVTGGNTGGNVAEGISTVEAGFPIEGMTCPWQPIKLKPSKMNINNLTFIYERSSLKVSSYTARRSLFDARAICFTACVRGTPRVSKF